MMRAYAPGLCLGILLAAASVPAQDNPPAPLVSSTQRVAEATSPDISAVYCSGFITDQRVPDEMRLVSGEQSNVKLIFSRGDVVFINRGTAQGVRVGDRFSVVRPVSEPNKVQWFKWQDKLLKAMGQAYLDAGQLRVTHVGPNIATAEVTFSCDYMQRGDIVRPYQERPSPPYRTDAKFDHFAAVSGKSVGMLVWGSASSEAFGKNSTAYINLGTNQGVKEGDYIRFFRYQGSLSETVPNTPEYAYKIYGFGSSPQRYAWNDLPREVIGEGVVMNASHNSCTVFVTDTRIDMYPGDYAEIE